MIIGFDGSRAFVDNRTGTENYSYQLLKHIAKIDRNNSYLVYLRPGNKVEGQWPGNFKFQLLNIKHLWTQAGLAKQTFFDKLDLLFVPSHTLPLISKPGLKTIMTVHDLGAEYLPKMHQLKQQLYLKWITKIQLKKATRLIAVSESTKKDLVKTGLDSKRIKVIYEGVEREVFKPVKGLKLDEALRKLDLKRGYLLFVGTIQPRKNLENLIKAYSSLDGTVKLVVAGGRGWLSDKIYKAAQQVYPGEVKMIGRVTDEQLVALYSGALAFVYPSLYEGFGLPVLEAFSCGCPVITSNTSSMPEVAGDAALLVDPLSPDDIAEKMKKIIEDDTLRDKLIVKGYKQLEKFSWDKCARQTLALFEEVYEQS